MKVKASVSFLAPEAGGHSKPILPGVRPQFKVGDLFTSSIVMPIAAVEVFERNVPYRVMIELPFGARYPAQIRAGMTVQLNDGSRIIGTGSVEEVVEP
jgi:translation elongation factor EF-Tu-like GTPase